MAQARLSLGCGRRGGVLSDAFPEWGDGPSEAFRGVRSCAVWRPGPCTVGRGGGGVLGPCAVSPRSLTQMVWLKVSNAVVGKPLAVTHGTLSCLDNFYWKMHWILRKFGRRGGGVVHCAALDGTSQGNVPCTNHFRKRNRPKRPVLRYIPWTWTLLRKRSQRRGEFCECEWCCTVHGIPQLWTILHDPLWIHLRWSARLWWTGKRIHSIINTHPQVPDE